jgi:hypothetical protein
MTPTIGRIVHYRISEADLLTIQRYRDAGAFINPYSIGEIVPMLIVKVWSDTTVNGKAILDGQADLWVSSRTMGEQPNQWCWPERVGVAATTTSERALD